MTPKKKNEMIGVPCADAPNNSAEPAPTPLERHQAAKAARERLAAAKAEAFPKSRQYRPAGDGTGHVGVVRFEPR